MAYARVPAWEDSLAASAPARIVASVAQPKAAGKAGFSWVWIAAALVLGAAIAALAASYRFGSNQTADSAVYLSAAESPMHGPQLTIAVGEPAGSPLTHYPPLYPVLLARAKGVGIGFLQAAAAIDFLAYCCCCFGAYWFVRRSEQPVWGLAAVLLLLCAGPLYYVNSLVGPDGPAIGLTIVALYLAGEYLRKRDWRVLVLCGMTLAAALLLRYVCAAFIGAACLAIVWGERERISWRRRLRSALLLGSIAGGPMALVLLVNRLMGSSATDRSAHLHPVTASMLKDLIDGLSGVFLPYQLPLWLRGVLLAALAVWAIQAALVRQRLGQPVRITVLFLGAYLLFLLVSMSLFDAATPFDDRILAPAVALMCILGALLLSGTWDRGGRLQRIGIGMVLIAGAAIGASHVRGVVKISAQTGTAAQLRQQYSGLLPVLDGLPKTAAVYSNVPFDLYLVTGRNARTLPRVVGYTDLAPRSPKDVDAELREMARQMSKTGGVIVYKLRRTTLWDAGLLSRTELEKRVAGLREMPGHAGFALYQIHPAGSRAANEAGLPNSPALP